MFSRNKPNESYIARQVWQQVTTPRIGILHELANKLLSEVENITSPGRLEFPAHDSFAIRRHSRPTKSTDPRLSVAATEREAKRYRLDVTPIV